MTRRERAAVRVVVLETITEIFGPEFDRIAQLHGTGATLRVVLLSACCAALDRAKREAL